MHEKSPYFESDSYDWGKDGPFLRHDRRYQLCHTADDQRGRDG